MSRGERYAEEIERLLSEARELDELMSELAPGIRRLVQTTKDIDQRIKRVRREGPPPKPVR